MERPRQEFTSWAFGVETEGGFNSFRGLMHDSPLTNESFRAFPVRMASDVSLGYPSDPCAQQGTYMRGSVARCYSKEQGKNKGKASCPYLVRLELEVLIGRCQKCCPWQGPQHRARI